MELEEKEEAGDNKADVCSFFSLQNLCIGVICSGNINLWQFISFSDLKKVGALRFLLLHEFKSLYGVTIGD